MDGDTSGLWFLVAVITGAVGAGVFIYGVRQKEPVSLAFGVIISIIPMFVSSAGLAAILSVAAIALFIVVRKYI